MSLVFEKFSLPLAPAQALSALHLRNKNENYLKAYFPGAAERYRDYPHAVKNVGRQAIQEGFHPYLLRPRELSAAIGIATIIRNTTVKHPNGHLVVGHNLHYWMDVDHQHPDIHHEVASGLMRKSRQLAWKYNRSPVAESPCHWDYTKEDAHHVFFAALPAEGHNPAEGLTDIMQPVGEPAELEFFVSGATIIETTGVQEQLYEGSEILTERPA